MSEQLRELICVGGPMDGRPVHVPADRSETYVPSFMTAIDAALEAGLRTWLREGAQKSEVAVSDAVARSTGPVLDDHHITSDWCHYRVEGGRLLFVRTMSYVEYRANSDSGG